MESNNSRTYPALPEASPAPMQSTCMPNKYQVLPTRYLASGTIRPTVKTIYT